MDFLQGYNSDASSEGSSAEESAEALLAATVSNASSPLRKHAPASGKHTPTNTSNRHASTRKPDHKHKSKRKRSTTTMDIPGPAFSSDEDEDDRVLASKKKTTENRIMAGGSHSHGRCILLG
jgi:hypothetical protein